MPYTRYPRRDWSEEDYDSRYNDRSQRGDHYGRRDERMDSLRDVNLSLKNGGRDDRGRDDRNRDDNSGGRGHWGNPDRAPYIPKLFNVRFVLDNRTIASEYFWSLPLKGDLFHSPENGELEVVKVVRELGKPSQAYAIVQKNDLPL